MKNKKSLTQSILKNIGSKEIKPVEKLKDINDVKLDLNSFIMVPINHPNINEIMALLNYTDIESKTENKVISQKSILNKEIYSEESNLDLNNKAENIRLIITLNDVLNKYNQEKIIIPKDSIITPLAKDYIKQKKIKVIFLNN